MTYPVGPGGVIAETEHWIVDHTFGSLGLGTLIVKPERAVLHVGDLTGAEAAEQLQVALFEAEEPPDDAEAAAFADRTRAIW